MGKISKALLAISKVLRDPWLLNKVFEDDDTWRKYVVDKYGLPKGLPIIQPEQIIKQYDGTLNTYSFLDGGSSVTDLLLLKNLASQIDGCHYFEIGTWRGESIANVAEASKEAYTLSLSVQEMEAKGWSRAYCEQHGLFAKDIANVHFLYGDSKQFDFSAFRKEFNLIFIDGDHHHDHVVHDTQQVLQHLLTEQGMIVWHDYGHGVESIRWEVLAAILDAMPKEKHKYLYQVANTKCAIYVQQQLKGSDFRSSAKPDKLYKVTIKPRPITKG